jgi:hypothetical protein
LVTLWYVQFQGVIIIYFSLVLPFIFSVFSLWECRASGGVLRYSGIGESCHATTNRYKHELYCTRVPSCTYSTFCDVIHLIIWVLSLRSIISNTCCTVCLPMKAELHFLPCCHTNLPNTATPYGQYGRPHFCGYMARRAASYRPCQHCSRSVWHTISPLFRWFIS